MSVRVTGQDFDAMKFFYEVDFARAKMDKEFESFEEFSQQVKGTGLSDDQMTAFISSRNPIVQGELALNDTHTFVYVKVDDFFIKYFLPLVLQRGFEEPPFYFHNFKGAGNPVGTHISAFPYTETRLIKINTLMALKGQKFTFKVKNFTTVVPDKWKGIAKIAIIQLECPELVALRKYHKLSPLPNEHDFNIVIGSVSTPSSCSPGGVHNGDIQRRCADFSKLLLNTNFGLSTCEKQTSRESLLSLNAAFGTTFRLDTPKLGLKLKLAEQMVVDLRARCPEYCMRPAEYHRLAYDRLSYQDTITSRLLIGEPIEKQLAVADEIDDTLSQLSLDVTGIIKGFTLDIVPEKPAPEKAKE